MSKKFLTPIDLVSNEIRNARVQNLASDPSSPQTGQFWLNTSDNRFRLFVDNVVRSFATLDDLQDLGGGDMVRSVYDADQDGIVDQAAAVPWSGVSDKPSSFPPSTHSHEVSDITGLQAALDGKAEATHSHDSSDITDFETAAVAAVLAHLDSEAGSDNDLDTFIELINQIKANRDSLVGQIKRYSTTIGDGSSTSFSISHSLNTRDIILQVYSTVTNEEVFTDVIRTNLNTATVNFSEAPDAGEYRVVVLA